MGDEKNLKFKNLLLRIVSALLLIPVVIYIIYSGIEIFYAAVIFISILMAVEWRSIIRKQKTKRIIWQSGAVLYICVFAISLLWIRYNENNGNILLWFFVTVWLADTGGFIFGKIIGGPKLIPKISPSKTWAGLVGLILASLMSGIIFFHYLGVKDFYSFVGTTVLLGVISQLGDWLESWIKRKAGIKDSGKLLPGHGGILDRVDSLVLSAPFLMLLLIFFRDYWF